jgi:hypothetical protein
MFGDARKSAAEANFLTSKPREVMRLAKASLTDSSSSTIEIRSFALAGTENAPCCSQELVLNINIRERPKSIEPEGRYGSPKEARQLYLSLPPNLLPSW